MGAQGPHRTIAASLGASPTGAAAAQAYAHGGLPGPNEHGDVVVPRYMMHKTYDLKHKTFAQGAIRTPSGIRG